MSGNADEAKFLYAASMGGVLSTGDTAFASQCVQCGKCLEKCPRHLEVPKLLESVVDELEGPDLGRRVAMAKEAFKRI